MHRALAASIVVSCLAPLDAVAQNFQFMPFAPRARTSVLPHWGFTGVAAGGDLDGDGRDEVVVPIFSEAGVFRHGATGWLAPTTVAWSSLTPQAPRLVDLDGDGDLDLVFVPTQLPAQTPLLLYANVQGSMTPVALPTPLVGTLLQGVAVGDLDGDGFAELVIATPPGSVVPSLVLARGGPGLQFTLDTTSMPTGLPLGLWPVLLDADSDGDLDVLASNATSGFRLVRNVGGTFVDATATLPAARTGHNFLTSADIDGDGRTDCAAVLTNGDVDMLWGSPGGFTFAQRVATVVDIRKVWPADFDGDGDLDLLAEHLLGLDVLWNQGNRQFVRADLVTEPTVMRGVADVDADGIADVLFAVVNEYLARCKYRARTEDAAFALGLAPPQIYNLAFTAPAAGDVDGDGRTDLVYLTWPSTITVEHALGGGRYRRSVSPCGTSNSSFFHSELADMDGDGDLDLVVKSDSVLIVAANDGTGTFTPSLQRPISNSTKDNLRVADMDGDGDLDIVHADSRGVVLTRNQGGGQYAATTVVIAAAPVPRCAEVADVDGDGDLDVISDVIAASGLTHVIVANDGAGNFAPSAGFYVNLGVAPTSVCAGDLDGDGDADLAVADGRPRIYRNDGNGVFADTTPFDLPPGLLVCGSNLAVADLDDDGDLDLGAIGLNSALCMLLFNNGAGAFVDLSALRTQILAFGVSGECVLRAADVDDDGDLDLNVGGGNPLAIMANHLRQCRSIAMPRLGGVAEFHLMSGPNFGQPGLGLLGVGFALAAPPLQLPGLAGRLDLDAVTLQIVASVAMSPVGVSSAFVPVPQDGALFGLEVWFQGAILPAVGQPGFTNAVYEIVLH